MYISFIGERLVTKSFGIDKLLIYQNNQFMMVNMTIGSENSVMRIENYTDKRFVVENAEAGVDCWKHQVSGLKLVQCKGNLQISNFFG